MTEAPLTDDDVRVGDDERRVVDSRLHHAVGAGQLTLSEYDERARDVWAARTRGELAAVVRDLPGGAPAVPSRTAGTRRAIAVMGEERLTGSVAPGQGVEGYAVMGSARLDLTTHDLPAHVRVRAVAVMGEVAVLVPEGATVELSGLSVMGDRSLRLGPAVPGAPVVHLWAVAVMGSVSVRSASMPTGAARVVAAVRSALPAQRAALVAPVHGLAPRRRHRGRWCVAGLGLAGLLGLGALSSAGSPEVVLRAPAAVEQGGVGAEVRIARPGEQIRIEGGVGEVTVVVPDRAGATWVRTGGLRDVECDDACKTTSSEVVTIRITGGVGDVEIETVSEHD